MAINTRLMTELMQENEAMRASIRWIDRPLDISAPLNSREGPDNAVLAQLIKDRIQQLNYMLINFREGLMTHIWRGENILLSTQYESLMPEVSNRHETMLEILGHIIQLINHAIYNKASEEEMIIRYSHIARELSLFHNFITEHARMEDELLMSLDKNIVRESVSMPAPW